MPEKRPWVSLQQHSSGIGKFHTGHAYSRVCRPPPLPFPTPNRTLACRCIGIEQRKSIRQPLEGRRARPRRLFVSGRNAPRKKVTFRSGFPSVNASDYFGQHCQRTSVDLSVSQFPHPRTKQRILKQSTRLLQCDFAQTQTADRKWPNPIVSGRHRKNIIIMNDVNNNNNQISI